MKQFLVSPKVFLISLFALMECYLTGEFYEALSCYNGRDRLTLCT